MIWLWWGCGRDGLGRHNRWCATLAEANISERHGPQTKKIAEPEDFSMRRTSVQGPGRCLTIAGGVDVAMGEKLCL